MKFNPWLALQRLHQAYNRRHRALRIPDRTPKEAPLRKNPFKIDPKLARSWLEPKKNTPDYSKLCQHHHQLVFIADELQTGHRWNSLLNEVIPLYDEAYTERPYVMLKYKDGEEVFPITLDPPYDTVQKKYERRAMVKGQVFQLTADEIELIDRHHNNTVDLHRTRVPILIPNMVGFKIEDVEGAEGELWDEVYISDVQHFRKRMWMYLGNFWIWNFQRECADSHKLLKMRDHNGSYIGRYSFTRNDF